jgi:superfamily II RNA helicase
MRGTSRPEHAAVGCPPRIGMIHFNIMKNHTGVSLLCPTELSLLEAFRGRYPFVLDPFQEEAIHHIAAGSSVIVSAPTGAGKTLIAEYAIFRALAQRQRLAYTTPIKALSNQKYADFCRRFGSESVGILTGDVQVNSQASILVMTTEILRNMFYLQPPENLGYVVLDECHYMGDEGRGTVWEEIIINCPRDVPLVALSATVSNIDEIAAWITDIHRPIVAIQHPVRPVPLEYFLVDPQVNIMRARDMAKKGHALLKDDGLGPRHRRRHGPDVSRLLLQLQARRWLPAIYFIFSRAGCEAVLRRCLRDGVRFIGGPGVDEVEAAIAKTLSDYPSITPESELNRLIFEGLRQGLGIHHAGMLAPLKRLTEVLFERGLVQVVFATETMSLGIHMPAKSVVIENLRKRSDYGFRTLRVGELMQMAGRAGRRGIDSKGTCLVVVEGRAALNEALRLIRGEPEPIESRFRIGYSSAAMLIQSLHDPQAIRKTIERSFGQFQNRRRLRLLEAERAQLLRQRTARGKPSKPAWPALEQRARQLALLQDSYWDEFLRITAILQHFGCLKAGELSPEGRLVATLRHDNELLVARVLFSGVLDGLAPAELAALLSCLSEESREGEVRYSWTLLKQHHDLQKRLQSMGRLAQELHEVQRRHQVTLPVSVQVGYLAASYHWASGAEDWAGLVRDTYGGHEGDLIRAFRRLIDLCHQLAESPEVEAALREQFWNTVSALDRGIVFESALI